MLENAEIAELFALTSTRLEGNKQKAMRRATRLALSWDMQVADMVAAGEDLKVLPGVGPWVADMLAQVIQDPPDEVPDPEPIRSGFMSFAAARRIVDDAPELRRSLRADLQMHSVYSDGQSSIADMASRAIELGHEYIAITDHSKGLKIAGGMSEEVVRAQRAEIDAVNEELADQGFRVLQGLEMNISPDGSGDMEPDCLAALDLVLGSFHSKLRIKDDQTERYLAALRNPHVHVLGHPRGRIYNFRAGLSADWEVVFAEAARLDKAVEVDCYPDRQDLNVPLLEIARDAGARISIGTDAHNPYEMGFIDLGAATAIEAGVEPERIINLMAPDDLVAWARSVAA